MISVVSFDRTSAALLRGVGRFKVQFYQKDVPESDKAVCTSQGVATVCEQDAKSA